MTHTELVNAFLSGDYLTAKIGSQTLRRKELFDLLKPRIGRTKSTLAAAMFLKDEITNAEMQMTFSTDNEEIALPS